MSTWIVITTADLNDYLVAAQAAALRSSALGSGQADPFTNVMHDRANYIRNRIAGRVQISATAYALPPELKGQACLLILDELAGRLPMLKLTDEQRRRVDRAFKDLDIAGTTQFPVSTPADPIDADVQSSPGPSLDAKDLSYDRTSQDGI